MRKNVVIINKYIIFSLLIISLIITQFALGFFSDKYLNAKIVMNGVNVTDAFNKDNAILIDPNNGAIAKIEYSITGNNSVEVRQLKTIFIFSDIDTISQTDNIDVFLPPGSNFIYIQTWKFNNHVVNENFDFISGIYKIRYDLYYSVEDQPKIIKSEPFYIKLDASPLLSVFGIISTVALASSGLSFIKQAKTLKNTISLELENSIGETRVSPTGKLKGYYRGKAYSIAQSELSNQLFGYASNLWTSERCPQCEEDLPKEFQKCPSCHITAEEAKELFTKSLVEKSLTAIKEIVDSVSGLSLKGIADKINEGITPTSNIISVVTFSGLTLIKPRVSKNWSQKQRKLIFTGLSSSIYALFWVQACGIGVISMTAMSIAILSGIIISIIINRITEYGLKAKINEYWDQKKSMITT
jgi:hypothetical protein